MATKATDSASAASDALDKSIETAVKTGQEVIEAKKHVADCVSPGTMTSCTTIQVSDVPDDAKKCPDDVTATSSSASVTEVFVCFGGICVYVCVCLEEGVVRVFACAYTYAFVSIFVCTCICT